MSPKAHAGIDRRLAALLWNIQGTAVVTPVQGSLNIYAPATGPVTRPILFTALREMPRSIVWHDAPAAGVYELTVRAGGVQTTLTGSRPAFSLSGLTADPGRVVTWRLRADDYAVTGYFWLLDANQAAALHQSQQIVAGIEDIEVRGIAQAIACAELGLYQEAVSILEALQALLPLHGRGVLVQRAFVTIFSEMKEKMPASVNNDVRIWAGRWLQAHAGTFAKCLVSGAGRLCG